MYLIDWADEIGLDNRSGVWQKTALISSRILSICMRGNAKLDYRIYEEMRLGTLKNSLLLNMGTLGPIGRIGRAPGTNGSIAGVLSYPMLGQDHSAIVFLPLFFLAVLLSIWICSRCEKILRRRDPSCVVIDEFLAMIFCLWLAEHVALYCHISRMPRPIFLIVGFLFFRVFDIFKPLGINALQKLLGGLGIILDDLLAAIYASMLLFWAIFLW